jgi:RNA polymerase sigma-70 factor (ECF subfamily)
MHALPSMLDSADAELPVPHSATRSGRPVALPHARWAGLAGHAATRFRAIVDEHFAFVWRSLRGLGVPASSADDGAQQVFWIAAQKLDTIAIGSERSFLFGTAIGVAANARATRARNLEVFDENALNARVDGAPDAEQLVDMRRQRAMLDQVLERMPQDLRSVFVLFVLEGSTTTEISTLLGLPSGTVASRLRRAREAFHEIARRIQTRSEFRGGSR